MIKFDRDNFANNLPDTYRQDEGHKPNEGSNNYKLLLTCKTSIDKFKKDTQDVFDCLDIQKATGATLDMYGDLVNQPRGNRNDDQYRLDILTRIMRNISSGDYNSIITAISTSFKCDAKDVKIVEADEPYYIKSISIPLNVVEHAELTQEEISKIIKQILPTTTKLHGTSFVGTFEFGMYETDYDEDTGFADDDQTLGGKLGSVITQEAIL